MPGTVGVDCTTLDEVPRDTIRVVGALGAGPVEGLAGVVLVVAKLGDASNLRDGEGEVVKHPRGDGAGFALLCPIGQLSKDILELIHLGG